MQCNSTTQRRLAGAAPVSIELEDFIGRTMSVLKHSWSEPGNFTEAYSLTGVASGMYRLVLRSGSRIVSQTVRIEK